MLSGNSICSLTRNGGFSNQHSLFLISHKNTNVSQLESNHISAVNLISSIVDCIFSMRGIGTAAYVSKDEFSVVDHAHNDKYNLLSIDMHYEASEDNLSIGNIFLDGILQPLYMPKEQVTNVPYEPKIGELKFVGLNTIQSNSQINYKTESFDGWLYPDGSTYQLTDFQESEQLKSTFTSTNTTFTLPKIENFIQSYDANKIDKSNLHKDISYKNFTPKHKHNVTLASTGEATINIELTMTARQGAGEGAKSNGFHGGDGQSTVISEILKKYNKDNGTKIKTSHSFLGVLSALNPTEDFWKDKWGDGYYQKQYKLNENSFPYSNKFKTTNEFDVECTCSFNSDGLANVIQAFEKNIETYPSHNKMPTMIYVGKWRRS